MLYNVAYCSNYSPVNYHQQQVGSHHHFITTVLSYLIELGYFSFQISEFPSFRVSKFPSFFFKRNRRPENAPAHRNFNQDEKWVGFCHQAAGPGCVTRYLFPHSRHWLSGIRWSSGGWHRHWVQQPARSGTARGSAECKC